jgi:UDP-N-acetylglucosamine 2-epimerase (non-hydrolysing)
MRVLVVLGTRPEAIKLAPVIRELAQRGLEARTCLTGQHREMVRQVLGLFGVQADHDLDVMRPDQSPSQVASAVLAGLEGVLQGDRPDWVLVQGDTTSAAAAALGAFYAGVRVGHVEAGLRTSDRRQPFPEEVNRQVVGVAADLHFAPTPRARANLLAEGVPPGRVEVTGNTVVDAVHWVQGLAFDRRGGPLESIAPAERVVLVTLHRRESIGAPMRGVCLALREIVGLYPGDVRLVLPVHPNPRVEEGVRAILQDTPGVTLTPPLDYLTLVHLMRRATLILTDSGGIQEEAPVLGRPVLVLRSVTERPEAVEAGVARLVGTDRGEIVRWTRRLLDDPPTYERMVRVVSPFGDGRAAERVVDRLLAD